MKKLICKLMVVSVLTAGLATGAYAMDVATFKKLAKDTIRQAMSGSIKDIDKLIAQQEKLFDIGVQGCREYAATAKNPKDVKIMNLVIKNADKMKAMTLDEIEGAWHEGGVLNKNGIDFDTTDHMGAAISHMDTVVHPATTYIALKEYKKTKDRDLLDQVKDELSEVLEHIENVE